MRSVAAGLRPEMARIGAPRAPDARGVDERRRRQYPLASRRARPRHSEPAERETGLGSVIKKRRKKMRKHKKRKLLRRARHKRKR